LKTRKKKRKGAEADIVGSQRGGWKRMNADPAGRTLHKDAFVRDLYPLEVKR